MMVEATGPRVVMAWRTLTTGRSRGVRARKPLSRGEAVFGCFTMQGAWGRYPIDVETGECCNAGGEGGRRGASPVRRRPAPQQERVLLLQTSGTLK